MPVAMFHENKLALCLVAAITKLLAPVATAHTPTNISTAPYPSRPNTPPIVEPLPASRSTPERMGPITAEMPLKIAVLAKAITVYSGLPPAQSKAAFDQVDENPPPWYRQFSVRIRMLPDFTAISMAYQSTEDECEEV